MKTVAIQGMRGSFHNEAATRIMPDATIIECTTFHDVFTAVNDGTADYGLVAIENGIHGSINAVYRLLERNDLWICAETLLKIEQYLIGSEDATLKDLDTDDAQVLSQAPALSQCELWLDEHLPNAKRIETHDTAASVRMVVESGNTAHAAIASKQAAAIYGGTILAGPINDDPCNYTRFVLLQKEAHEALNANRTSIILTTGNAAGALYHALGVFMDTGINLSRIDSHPIPRDTRHYAFYIDFDAGLSSPQAQLALQKFKQLGYSVKVLGSYRADTEGRDACSI